MYITDKSIGLEAFNPICCVRLIDWGEGSEDKKKTRKYISDQKLNIVYIKILFRAHFNKDKFFNITILQKNIL